MLFLISYLVCSSITMCISPLEHIYPQSAVGIQEFLIGFDYRNVYVSVIIIMLIQFAAFKNLSCFPGGS